MSLPCLTQFSKFLNYREVLANVPTDLSLLRRGKKTNKSLKVWFSTMHKCKIYSSVKFYICINTCPSLRSNIGHFHFIQKCVLMLLLRSILLLRVNHYSIFNHYTFMLPIFELHMFNAIICMYCDLLEYHCFISGHFFFFFF